MTITDDFPTGHATLSDGTTTIPFIFTDGNGKKNQRAFTASPYPRTALKTTTGESKYSDLEPPYFAIPQDDFTGGRGNEDFEADSSRYNDGHNIDTNKESGIVLTGRESYSTGYRDADFQLPGSVNWKALYDTTRYFAGNFLASSTYTSYQCEVWIRKVGSPGAVQVELWSNNGSPNAMLASKTTTAANVTTDTLSLFLNSVWTGTTLIESGSTYWVVIDGGAGTNAANHWEIGYGEHESGKISSDGSSWSADSSPYYRITPNTGGFIAKFFEYKRGLYMVTQANAGSNSVLYINGDRGTADSNTGAKTTLIDGTKSWTTNEWEDDIVLITNGPGSEEKQNWRVITGNDGTTLTSATWNVTHTTATEYVILGSDKWTVVVADLGGFVTDVAVSGEFMYFALGENTAVKRYMYYTVNEAWTFSTDSEQCEASVLLGLLHSDRGNVLYGAVNEHELYNKGIWNGNVPLRPGAAMGDLYSDLGTLVPTNEPWDVRSFTNVTQKLNNGITRIDVAAGFTTGTIAVKNLDTPLDITAADRIVFLAKSSANVSTAGHLEFVYDDVEDLGREWAPNKVFKADYGYNRQPTKVYLLDEEGGSPTWTDLPETYDGIAGNFETVTIESDDRIMIGYSKPFNKIYFDLGTVNDVVADITVAYFNGQLSVSLTNSDGTETGSDTSLGQDGIISWAIPENWVVQTVNEVEAYWIHLTWNNTLKTGVTIKRIYVTLDEQTSMVPLYDDLTNVYDGTTYSSELMKLGTEDFIYIGNSNKFNKITVDVGTANDIASVMTASYFDEAGWTAVTIDDDGTDVGGDTLKQDGDITFTIPWNWKANSVNNTEAYWIRLDVSNALVTDFSINKITVTRENNSNNDLTALNAGDWQQIEVTPAGGFSAFPIPNASAVKSVGFRVDSNQGAFILDIKDVKLVQSNVDWLQASLPASHRINGMEAYSGNVDDPIENPWIFTEAGVYELQTQNDGQVVAIPLRELSSLQSSENGLGHTVNGTYLYFNIGEKIQRYFNRTLDDIGPDRDEGLPAARQGIPMSMTSYPGRVYAGIDANTGNSSVLNLRGSAWSETYRAPKTGTRIRNVYVQAIPGTNVDRLWISKGADVLWVPISLNPYNDADFTYMHEGYLTTSWIYAGMMDVEKLWKSLKVFAEDVSSNRYIVVDYQTNTSSTWTEIGTFDTAPVEEIDIASTLPQAKRIRYRLRFYTNDVSESPRLKAIVTEGVAFVPTKNQYSWTFAIKKTTENINLKGEWDDSLTSVEQYDKLLSWANAGTPLTLEHHSTLYAGKTVFIDPISVSPLEVVDNIGKENHVAQLTCIEV